MYLLIKIVDETAMNNDGVTSFAKAITALSVEKRPEPKNKVPAARAPTPSEAQHPNNKTDFSSSSSSLCSVNESIKASKWVNVSLSKRRFCLRR